jgi:hypothetical protein
VVRELDGAGGKVDRTAKADAHGGWARAGEQLVAEREHGAEIVSGVGAVGRGHLAGGAPFALAAGRDAGRVLGAAEVEGQDQVTHLGTIP